MLLKDNFIYSLLQLIKVLTRATNDRPNMIGIFLHSSAFDSISKRIKSTRYMNLLIWTNTSSIIHFGTLIDYNK